MSQCPNIQLYIVYSVKFGIQILKHCNLCQATFASLNSLKNGSFRNRENLQYRKTAYSVLLSLFMRTNGKNNNSHAPITVLSGILLSVRISKGAKIRNRYNHIPHLTQDTNGRLTSSQLDTTNERQEVSPFPAGGHKAQINRRTQRHNKHMTENINDPQKKYRLGTFSKKYFTGGLKPVTRRQPNP